MKNEVDTGWIKVHRKMQENWIYPKSREYTRFEAWIDLLLNANHTEQKVFLDKKSKTYLCKRGQQLRSMQTLSKKWNWSRSKVRRFFELLQNESMVVLNPDQNTTLITVCNYDNYQSDRPTDEHQANIERTSGEHQADINKNDKKEKNGKNVRMFTPPSLSEVENYFVENGYKKEIGKKAWMGYNVAGWINTKGKPVLNWKQTMINVWFSEENKINSFPTPQPTLKSNTLNNNGNIT